MRGDHPGTEEVDKEASPERALYLKPLYLKFSITRLGGPPVDHPLRAGRFWGRENSCITDFFIQEIFVYLKFSITAPNKKTAERDTLERRPPSEYPFHSKNEN